jgi:hypothetical protein
MTSRGDNPEKGVPMHPATSTQTEGTLRARHLDFTFEPNLPIARIREAEGNQVRLIANRAPKAMVGRYAEQMKGGSVFPAIVVNERNEIVDGNTRYVAARTIDRETIAAYVCVGLSALEARSLSVELNQCNGLAMSEEDIRAFVAGAVEDGQTLDVKAYSRMTGVKASRLSRWIAAKQFELRARRAGISEEGVGALSDSVRAALQVARLRAVFGQATSLAVEARVSAAEINSIVREANAAPSEADALAVVTKARDLRTEEVRRYAVGFRGSRRRGARASLHIRSLLRFAVDDLLDVDPARQEETLARMVRLRDRLDGVIDRATLEWTRPEAKGSVDDQRTAPDMAKVA